MNTDVVQHGRPPFHRYALKHGQHSESNIVKTDDAFFWTFPLLLAVGSSRVALISASGPRV